MVEPDQRPDRRDSTKRLLAELSSNSVRLTALEGLAARSLASYRETEAENKAAFARIEEDLKDLMLDLTGIKYMARGARWVVGLLIGFAVWLLHEARFIRDFFKGIFPP
jgi:hypothetical protein